MRPYYLDTNYWQNFAVLEGGSGSQVIQWIQGFVPTEIPFTFGKFKGYIHSSVGSSAVPVDRLAGWLVDKYVTRFAKKGLIHAQF